METTWYILDGYINVALTQNEESSKFGLLQLWAPQNWTWVFLGECVFSLAKRIKLTLQESQLSPHTQLVNFSWVGEGNNFSRSQSSMVRLDKWEMKKWNIRSAMKNYSCRPLKACSHVWIGRNCQLRNQKNELISEEAWESKTGIETAFTSSFAIGQSAS